MPITQARLIAAVAEGEAALRAFRDLAAALRAIRDSYRAGVYDARTAFESTLAALADIDPPTGEVLVAERLHYARTHRANAEGAARAKAYRVRASLAAGLDPDARANDTAPSSITHDRAEPPAWLREAGARGRARSGAGRGEARYDATPSHTPPREIPTHYVPRGAERSPSMSPAPAQRHPEPVLRTVPLETDAYGTIPPEVPPPCMDTDWGGGGAD